MGILEGDAHPGVFGESALAPRGFIGDELEYTAGASGIELQFASNRRSTGDARGAEKIQAELDGIFARGVCQLVGKGLEDPRKSVAAGSAQSIRRNAERHERSAEEKVTKKCARELVAGDAGGRSELSAFAETDEVIAPGDEFARRIETALEEMKTGGAIVIVVKIVFASPEKFDGNTDLLGDGASFEHVVVGETTAESASSAL